MWEQMNLGKRGKKRSRFSKVRSTIKVTIVTSLWAMTWHSAHSLNRLSRTMKNGQKIDYWHRWTACFRKVNGKWLVTHQHVSLPSDLESGKAVMDLKP